MADSVSRHSSSSSSSTAHKRKKKSERKERRSSSPDRTGVKEEIGVGKDREVDGAYSRQDYEDDEDPTGDQEQEAEAEPTSDDQSAVVDDVDQDAVEGAYLPEVEDEVARRGYG
jgi:hypothetical protein